MLQDRWLPMKQQGRLCETALSKAASLATYPNEVSGQTAGMGCRYIVKILIVQADASPITCAIPTFAFGT